MLKPSTIALYFAALSGAALAQTWIANPATDELTLLNDDKMKAICRIDTIDNDSLASLKNSTLVQCRQYGDYVVPQPLRPSSRS
ncbi:MAG: hypothetical protein JO171_14255 [Paludibacterium sp.]|uniref:hypothetical protein n=1 Tax=Paludibacterium sp. TaxID=1917523 RepID=UPI0025F46683|nr:hypothetical protein [Paludibacterium sp.]MBV8048317.1 hypothetical protein [Paludibacterium sp.]MBV8648589.1 hypothetical protein [Paludibacterium sp.]